MVGLINLIHTEIPIMIGCKIVVECTEYQVVERSPILALFQPNATQPQIVHHIHVKALVLGHPKT